MKLIKENKVEVKEENAFDDLRDLRDKLGDDLILDEMIEELSYPRLQEFVAYIKRRYKSILDEFEPLENDEEDD